MEQTPETAGSLQYCSDLLKSGDEDRWLTAQFAADRARARLLALFSFYREIERVPEAVSEAPLGEIRLQWWRDALDEIVNGERPRAHPVVQALAQSGLCAGPSMERLAMIIDARARLLYGEPFESLAGLSAFLRESEGALALTAAGEGSPAAVEGLGLSYALTRFAPVLAPKLAEEARKEAATLWREAVPALANLGQQAKDAVRYVALTPAYRRGRAPSGLAKRLRLAWSVASGRL